MSVDQMELPWHQGTGAERKAAALEELAALRKEALAFIRAKLLLLFVRRRAQFNVASAAEQRVLGEPFVCADDARRIFEEWQQDKPTIPRAFLGAVFKDEGWKPLSKHPDHPSTLDRNHGRLLLRWTHHVAGA